MSDNPISSQIEAELQKPAARLARKLASCRVDISEEIPPPEAAWEIQELDSELLARRGSKGCWWAGMWPGVVRRIRVNGESFAYPSLCLVRYTERYRGCEKPVFVTGRSGQGS